VVADIDEGERVAVLAAGGDPPRECDGRSDVFCAEVTTLVSPQGR